MVRSLLVTQQSTELGKENQHPFPRGKQQHSNSLTSPPNGARKLLGNQLPRNGSPRVDSARRNREQQPRQAKQEDLLAILSEQADAFQKMLLGLIEQKPSQYEKLQSALKTLLRLQAKIEAEIRKYAQTAAKKNQDVLGSPNLGVQEYKQKPLSSMSQTSTRTNEIAQQVTKELSQLSLQLEEYKQKLLSLMSQTSTRTNEIAEQVTNELSQLSLQLGQFKAANRPVVPRAASAPSLPPARTVVQTEAKRLQQALKESLALHQFSQTLAETEKTPALAETSAEEMLRRIIQQNHQWGELLRQQTELLKLFSLSSLESIEKQLLEEVALTPLSRAYEDRAIVLLAEEEKAFFTARAATKKKAYTATTFWVTHAPFIPSARTQIFTSAPARQPSPSFEDLPALEDKRAEIGTRDSHFCARFMSKTNQPFSRPLNLLALNIFYREPNQDNTRLIWLSDAVRYLGIQEYAEDMQSLRLTFLNCPKKVKDLNARMTAEAQENFLKAYQKLHDAQALSITSSSLPPEEQRLRQTALEGLEAIKTQLPAEPVLADYASASQKLIDVAAAEKARQDTAEKLIAAEKARQDTAAQESALTQEHKAIDDAIKGFLRDYISTRSYYLAPFKEYCQTKKSDYDLNFLNNAPPSSVARVGIFGGRHCSFHNADRAQGLQELFDLLIDHKIAPATRTEKFNEIIDRHGKSRLWGRSKGEFLGIAAQYRTTLTI